MWRRTCPGNIDGSNSVSCVRTVTTLGSACRAIGAKLIGARAVVRTGGWAPAIGMVRGSAEPDPGLPEPIGTGGGAAEYPSPWARGRGWMPCDGSLRAASCLHASKPLTATTAAAAHRHVENMAAC